MTRSISTRLAATLTIGAAFIANSGTADARGGGGGGSGYGGYKSTIRDHRGSNGVPQGGVTVENTGSYGYGHR